MALVAPRERKHLSADALFSVVRSGFAAVLDYRLSDTDISLTDALIVAFVYLEWIQRKHPHPLTFHNLSRPVRWLIYTGLLWATIYWGTHSPVQFIYFQF